MTKKPKTEKSSLDVFLALRMTQEDLAAIDAARFEMRPTPPRSQMARTLIQDAIAARKPK